MVSTCRSACLDDGFLVEGGAHSRDGRLADSSDSEPPSFQESSGGVFAFKKNYRPLRRHLSTSLRAACFSPIPRIFLSSHILNL